MQDLPDNKFEGKPCCKCGGTLRYRTAKPGGRRVACVEIYTAKRQSICRVRLNGTKGKTYHGKPCRKCAGTLRYTYNDKCIPCHKKAMKRSADKHREKYKARYKDRYKDQIYNRPAVHQKLGITLERFTALEAQQNNRCMICGDEPKFPRLRLCVDHDHATGHFRGLLCGQCNTGLGSFKDSPETLRKAADYLENNGWSL